jgi:hypothetical protein
MEQVEDEEHQPRRVAGVRGAWIMLNEVMPSGKTPHCQNHASELALIFEEIT